MSRIKAVIFDMDGVLVNTKKIWSKVDKEFLKKREITYNDEYKSQVTGRDQKDVAKFYKSIFRLKDSVNLIIRERNKIAYKHYKNELQLMPYAFNTIKILHQAGFKLALASNASVKLINAVLKKFNLKKYFLIKMSGEFLKRGKPDPDIYLRTAKQLKIKPENCLVIEDSPNGVRSAKRAGMYCIGVLNTKLD